MPSLVACGIGAAGWFGAGWLAETGAGTSLGLAALGPLWPIAASFIALSGAERVFARLLRHDNP